MKVRITGASKGTGLAYTLKCPHCGHDGTFEPIKEFYDLVSENRWLGHRACPNPACLGHIFTIADYQHKLMQTFPPQRIGMGFLTEGALQRAFL